MAAWQRTAAWALLVLALAGALLPPLVLFLLSPKIAVRSTQHVVGQVPLDVFFLLDASSSVKREDWELALGFAQDMASRLNGSFPIFRAGLGQFSSHYRLEVKLSPDLRPFDTLPQRVEQLGGTTFMDRALCGSPAEGSTSGSGCASGALADMSAAPDREMRAGVGVGCGVQRAAEVIMLVTDGMPTNGWAALQSARHLKRRSNATLMGVLVGGEDAHARTLYALTSCCAADDMELRDGRPACGAEANWSCPNIVRSTSYSDLARSSGWLAEALTSDMECEQVSEQWNTHADLRSLWFLLLPLPVLAYALGLQLAGCLVPRWEAATASLRAAEDPRGTSGGSRPLARHCQDEGLGPPEETEPLDPEVAAAPAVPGPSSPAEQPSSSLLVGVGQSLGSHCERGLAEGPVAGYQGKKWAPVRTAYIVAGMRLDVDYGRQAPPTAPNAARRGNEQASIRDTPEAYFANLDRSPEGRSFLTLTTLSLVETLADPVGGEEQEDAPQAPLSRFGILLPLACTLALLPPVVLWSGIVGLWDDLGG